MSPTTARRRLTREESRAQTRERLIDTAQQLFVSNGYGGASIRDIADKAGYSQGAFYSNFSSKEDVLLELLRRHMEAEAMQLSTVMGKDSQQPDQMLAELDAWASTLNQDADWCMLSIELQLHANRSPTFAAEYQKVWDKHRSEIGGVIGLLFEKIGRAPPAALDELAAAFMALSHGLALQRTTDRLHPSGRMIMVFLRGLIASANSESPG
ncbi:TetR family transcriptional regulator [Acidovorax sp. Root275]|uniref:TetR/AcrR family transcriptional regulator n=1 Tax=unclassified Acidovorax TaxID=2684926 RepID=UPI00070BE719|nr:MULTISPECIES: TetR/AcrR family transcriptional regulator [unclassified Acidovorax]KRD26450.1 TetR family transcriptional regulator [Acidovorax sp. Root267]KRD47894.1 TetR family transcriptional regulator [Acidovorax sp. Root275]OGA88951.1 MAG: TetR family transcriptional regulator [Burkholderiales bacterium GWA2_64_37]